MGKRLSIFLNSEVDLKAMGIVEFDGFRLDAARCSLRDPRGRPKAVPPKAIELLDFLIHNRHRIVGRDELRAKLWGGLHVTDGNLTQTVFLIRRALGDHRKPHRFIANMPGKGYRFVGEIQMTARQLFLKGQFFWNKRTFESLQKSIRYFNLALDRAPKFALAYSGLAETYALLNMYGASQSRDAFTLARNAAQKALEFDDTLSAPHVVMGLVSSQFDFDWPEAEKHFRKALSVDPGDATAHQWYGEFLAMTGRFSESILHLEQAYAIEPQSVAINTARAYPFLRLRQFDRAIQLLNSALEMDGSFPLARFYLAKCLAAKGSYEEAQSEYEQAVEASNGSSMMRAGLAFALAMSTRRTEASKILKRLEQEGATRYISPYVFATVHAALGDVDVAFRWLDRAYDERDYLVATVRDDIHFDRIRTDPRFDRFLIKLRLRPAKVAAGRP